MATWRSERWSMVRRSWRKFRATVDFRKATIKLFAIGGVLALASAVLGCASLYVISALWPLGLLLLVVGSLSLWLAVCRGRSVDAQVKTPAFVHPPELASNFAQSRVIARRTAETPLQEPKPAEPGAHELARPMLWSDAVFQGLEWRRFEALVEALFQQVGFATKSLSHGPDGGVDIWLYSPNQPGNAISIVQCKHGSDKVGVDKIRELRGIMAAYGIQRGQYATSSYFTADAIAFAHANSITPLDAVRLLGLIAQRTPMQQRELLAVALNDACWTPPA